MLHVAANGLVILHYILDSLREQREDENSMQITPSERVCAR